MTPDYSCNNQGAFRAKPPDTFKIISDPVVGDNYIIRWMLCNYSPDLTLHEQVSVFKDIFAFYAHELWPIQFESVEHETSAHIKIYFVSEDGFIYDSKTGKQLFASPFDFKESPNTLAVQYTKSPGFPWSLCQFINDTHFWAYKKKEGTYSLKKAVWHELGHGLGLGHTTEREGPRDIMLPYYSEDNYFSDDARAGLDKIYRNHRYFAMSQDPAAMYLLKRINEQNAKANGLEAERDIASISLVAFVIIAILLIIVLWALMKN